MDIEVETVSVSQVSLQMRMYSRSSVPTEFLISPGLRSCCSSMSVAVGALSLAWVRATRITGNVKLTRSSFAGAENVSS